MFKDTLTFRTFAWRVTAAHMLTYFVVGFIAFMVFDYRTLYATTELRHLMRSTDSAWVAAGPALQVVRGLLFAAVLWPLRERLLGGPQGGLTLFGLMVGLASLDQPGQRQDPWRECCSPRCLQAFTWWVYRR